MRLGPTRPAWLEMVKIDSGHRLELIELIYAAGVDPTGWGDVIARLGELLPHAAVAFQAIDLQGASPAVLMVENWEDGAAEAYASHFAAISPWVPTHHAAQVGVPYVAARTCPVSSYRSSEFFSDFVEPYKVMTGAVAVKLFDDARNFATVSMNYDEDKGDLVLPPLEQLLRELSPHLQRAIEMNRKFAALEVRAQSMEGLLDRMALPAFLVERGSRVRYMNGPAMAAVSQGRGLWLDAAGGLSLARREDTARLHAAIVRASSPDGARTDIGDGFFTFAVPGELGPNMAWVSPLISSNNQLLLRSAGSPLFEVLVTIQYRRDETPIPQQHLMQAFGLTAAESQLVIALASGTSLADYADQVERSLHTVRLHLKRALAKTACHSQSQLVALVWRTIGRPQ